MKNIHQLLLPTIFFATGFILNSCTKIIDMNVPEKEKKLVVNGVICPDSIISVNISKSLGILENNDQNVFINDAEVTIYEDDIKKEILRFLNDGDYTASFTPSQNKTYKIEVSHAVYTSVSATSYIPAKIPITIDTASGYNQSYGSGVLSCKLKFKDPANENNYYLMRVFDESHRHVYLSLSDNEPVVKEYGGDYLFTDNLIDGKEYILNFDLNSLYTYYKIVFYQITKDYYNYLVSYHNNNNSDDPFSEPVIVYSNIKNGYGIFSGYNKEEREIIIK
mgnify:FL=1